MRRTIGITGVLIAALVEIAWAQAQAPGPQLTLQDAEAMALKNHPQVLAAQANFLRAGQIVTEARSAYYPTVNGNITGAQANPSSRLGAGVPMILGCSTTLDRALRLRNLLPILEELQT